MLTAAILSCQVWLVSMENWRPHNEIAAVTLFNTHNKPREWMTTRYERLS